MFLPQTGQKIQAPLLHGAAAETGLFPRWWRTGQELSGELVCKKGQLNGELCKERCNYIVNSCKLVFACLLVDFCRVWLACIKGC